MVVSRWLALAVSAGYGSNLHSHELSGISPAKGANHTKEKQKIQFSSFNKGNTEDAILLFQKEKVGAHPKAPPSMVALPVKLRKMGSSCCVVCIGTS